MLTSRLLPTLFLLAALGACAPRFPLGISEAQWQTMSTEQRLAAQAKQAELDRAAEERRTAEARAREAEAARARAELELRRQNARYGERIQCVLSEAEAHLAGKWRPIAASALDLVQGWEQPVELEEAGGRKLHYRMSASALFDGQTLSLCRDGNDCIRLVGTFQDYRRGIDRRFDSPRFLKGRLHCDLAPAPGMPRHR